jgi:hypothetical protein
LTEEALSRMAVELAALGVRHYVLQACQQPGTTARSAKAVNSRCWQRGCVPVMGHGSHPFRAAERGHSRMGGPSKNRSAFRNEARLTDSTVGPFSMGPGRRCPASLI